MNEGNHSHIIYHDSQHDKVDSAKLIYDCEKAIYFNIFRSNTQEEFFKNYYAKSIDLRTQRSDNTTIQDLAPNGERLAIYEQSKKKRVPSDKEYPSLKFREIMRKNEYVQYSNIRDSSLPKLKKNPQLNKEFDLDEKKKNLQPAQTNIISVNEPAFVFKRSDINRNPRYFQEERKPFEVTHVDSHLKRNYPLRKNLGVSFVKKHILGFKNKENTDLFKHYYRIYKKNKFIIEKALRDTLNIKRERLEEKKIELAKNWNEKSFFPLGDIDSASEMKNEGDHDELEIKLVPLEVKEFIIDCYLTDTQYFDTLIKQYILNKNIDVDKKPQKTMEMTLERQSHINVVSLNVDSIPQAPIKTHEEQDKFISFVMERIRTKHNNLKEADLKTAHELIDNRKQQLLEMKQEVANAKQLKQQELITPNTTHIRSHSTDLTQRTSSLNPDPNSSLMQSKPPLNSREDEPSHTFEPKTVVKKSVNFKIDQEEPSPLIQEKLDRNQYSSSSTSISVSLGEFSSNSRNLQVGNTAGNLINQLESADSHTDRELSFANEIINTSHFQPTIDIKMKKALTILGVERLKTIEEVNKEEQVALPSSRHTTENNKDQLDDKIDNSDIEGRLSNRTNLKSDVAKNDISKVSRVDFLDNSNDFKKTAMIFRSARNLLRQSEPRKEEKAKELLQNPEEITDELNLELFPRKISISTKNVATMEEEFDRFTAMKREMIKQNKEIEEELKKTNVRIEKKKKGTSQQAIYAMLRLKDKQKALLLNKEKLNQIETQADDSVPVMRSRALTEPKKSFQQINPITPHIGTEKSNRLNENSANVANYGKEERMSFKNRLSVGRRDKKNENEEQQDLIDFGLDDDNSFEERSRQRKNKGGYGHLGGDYVGANMPNRKGSNGIFKKIEEDMKYQKQQEKYEAELRAAEAQKSRLDAEMEIQRRIQRKKDEEMVRNSENANKVVWDNRVQKALEKEILKFERMHAQDFLKLSKEETERIKVEIKNRFKKEQNGAQTTDLKDSTFSPSMKKLLKNAENIKKGIKLKNLLKSPKKTKGKLQNDENEETNNNTPQLEKKKSIWTRMKEAEESLRGLENEKLERKHLEDYLNAQPDLKPIQEKPTIESSDVNSASRNKKKQGGTRVQNIENTAGEPEKATKEKTAHEKKKNVNETSRIKQDNNNDGVSPEDNYSSSSQDYSEEEKSSSRRSYSINISFSDKSVEKVEKSKNIKLVKPKLNATANIIAGTSSPHKSPAKQQTSGAKNVQGKNTLNNVQKLETSSSDEFNSTSTLRITRMQEIDMKNIKQSLANKINEIQSLEGELDEITKNQLLEYQLRFDHLKYFANELRERLEENALSNDSVSNQLEFLFLERSTQLPQLDKDKKLRFMEQLLRDIAIHKFKVEADEDIDSSDSEDRHKVLIRYVHYLSTNCLEIFKRKRQFRLESKMINRLKSFLLNKNSHVEQQPIFKNKDVIDQVDGGKLIRSQSVGDGHIDLKCNCDEFTQPREKYLEKLKRIKLKNPKKLKELAEKMEKIKSVQPQRDPFSLKLY